MVWRHSTSFILAKARLQWRVFLLRVHMITCQPWPRNITLGVLFSVIIITATVFLTDFSSVLSSQYIYLRIWHTSMDYTAAPRRRICERLYIHICIIYDGPFFRDHSCTLNCAVAVYVLCVYIHIRTTTSTCIRITYVIALAKMRQQDNTNGDIFRIFSPFLTVCSSVYMLIVALCSFSNNTLQ